jgi:hypothetical protein
MNSIDGKHDWKAAFLTSLASVPVVNFAAKAAGINRVTAFRHRKTDPDFAEAWDEAIELSVDNAEREAFRRAIAGYDEPVIHRGQLQYVMVPYEQEDGSQGWRVAQDDQGKPVPLVVRKHSDALLALILKGRRKSVYAERHEVTGADGGAVAVSDSDRAARVAQLMATAAFRKDHPELADVV